MKNILALLVITGLFLGCSVTSEKYRYKWRFDKFYGLLNNEEKSCFASNDLDKLSASLKSRLESDKKLKENWDNVQFYEAIKTFDVLETTHFFRAVILKELNRDNYYIFMNMLDGKAQQEFAKNINFTDDYERYYKTNFRFKSFVDSLKIEYRMYGFSNEQVSRFLREVIFPEVSRKELYPLLKLLKDSQVLSEFKAGNISAASKKLSSDVESSPIPALNLQKIMRNSGLTHISVNDLLDIYYQVIMKEMDAYALSQTLSKF
jgi:hypothetical protein